MTQLRLRRHTRTAESVIGDLYADDAYRCYTLEDAPERGGIPAGTYRVDLTVSPRAALGQLWTPDPEFRLPLVHVPGRAGIRIHAGNTARDVEGCVLVGLTKWNNGIGQSRLALGLLMQALTYPATLTVEDLGA
jgi:hypothetical protein